MFFGVLLIITWLVLLLRYPAKALPVSLAAAVGLGFVAVWVVWLDNREASQLARLELRITYDATNNGKQAALMTLEAIRQRIIEDTWPPA